jgi:predicted dehydrogenase
LAVIWSRYCLFHVSASKIAIVGCGRIAHLLERDPLRYKPCTHLGAIKILRAKRRAIQLIGYCDTNTNNAAAAAAFMGDKNAFITQKFHDVIATSPDLLVIASSTDSHFTILAAAMRANIRRIVIEKPVAFSQTEATKLRSLQAKSKSIVLPNYERRYHPKYLKLRQTLGAKKGPHSYRAFFAAGGRSLYARPGSGDEGVLLHDTTHLVDLAQFLFGDVRRATVSGGKHRHVLYLEHADGSTGVLETCLGVGVFHLEMEIHLANARITVGNGFTSVEKIRASKHYRSLKSYSTPQRKDDGPVSVNQNPFMRLYTEALGHPTNPDHFSEALANVEILTRTQ